MNISCRLRPRRSVLRVFCVPKVKSTSKELLFLYRPIPHIQHRNIKNRFEYTEIKLKVITDRTDGE